MNGISQNKDVLYCIVSKFSSIKNILKMRVLSLFYYNFIKDTFWNNITIKTDSDHQLKFFLDNFNFAKYDIRNLSSQIPENDLKKMLKCTSIRLYSSIAENNLLYHLRNCNIISLQSTYFSSDGLKYLSSCKDVDFSYCAIGNIDLNNFVACDRIKLYWCENINDFGIHSLSHCRIIDLSRTRISDTGIILLKNVRVLTIMYCKKVTGDSFINLPNLTKLNCSHCPDIKDNSINLPNLTKLNCSYCPNIKDSSIVNLINLKVLLANRCEKITDIGIKNLVNVRTFNLGSSKITDDSNFLFKKCDRVFLGNTKITDKTLENLNNCREISLAYTNVSSIGIKKLVGCRDICLIGCHDLGVAAFDYLTDCCVRICDCKTYRQTKLQKNNNVLIMYVASCYSS
jgi:hypothetical protein